MTATCRAAEYYRQAFFWHREALDGTELTTAYAASVKAFRAALPLLDRPGAVLEGDTPGYFFAPEGDGPFPTILHIGGYDGTAEELYPSVYPALAAATRSPASTAPAPVHLSTTTAYRCDRTGSTSSPAWSTSSCRRPEVDPNRIVLVGRSFGGVLAPRGASGEPRLAAMVVDPGQYDLSTAMAQRFGDLWKSVDDPAADAQFESLLEIPTLKTLLAPRMVTNGVTSVRAFCADSRRYNSVDQAPTITCPSFVTDNETDLVSTGQGQVLFDHLTCPKTFRRFTQAEGAEGHCEGMAPIVFWTAAYDWLDDTLS